MASPRAAYRQPADRHRGLADAHRHPLPRLAALADAGVEGHVVADGTDLLHRGGAIAVSCCANRYCVI